MFRFSQVLLFCLLMTACASAVGDVEPDVSHVKIAQACIEDREALLALDYEAFDQDFQGGWRAVSEQPGCMIAAAELIVEYNHQLISNGNPVRKSLPWHAGQLYASEGETQKAISLFKQSYAPVGNSKSWNLYVDASIAFLEKDRAGFDQKFKELRDLPKPPNWEQSVKYTQEKWGYTPQWPNNLNVFEAFDRCFEKTYSEAYGACNRGIRRIDPTEEDSGEPSESP